MKFRLVLPLMGLGWLFAVIFGLGFMLKYQETPGLAAQTSGQWPRQSHIPPGNGVPTLLLLAHPKCPCTRASIGELNSLLASCAGKTRIYVLFLKPKGFPQDWEKTDLWRSASAIPGVTAICDEGGREARLFHVATSGETLLFDGQGRLLFSGGITGGRGHAGDNPGKSAVISWINTGKAPLRHTQVYGCALLDPNAKDGVS